MNGLGRSTGCAATTASTVVMTDASTVAEATERLVLSSAERSAPLSGVSSRVGGSRTLSAILGGAAGAALGQSTDSGRLRCR